MNQFKGFSKELYRFLDDLAANNNRKWFNENKERYLDVVVEPVTEFIYEMGDRLDDVSKHFVADPRRNGGSMFRIYKDTRFSKDKRPYKENVGCHFRHEAGKSAHAPGFYLHLESGNTFIGAGIWKPPNNVLDNIRTAIVEKSDDWDDALNNKKLVRRFGDVEGERLKRPPRGYDVDHPMVEDLKFKSYFLRQHIDDESTMSPKFINELMRAYSDATPMMKFITNAVGLPY